MTAPTPQRPALLVIGTGLRSYREYLLRSISSQFRIHLFHTAEPSWEKDYIAGWTVLPSTADGPAMAEAARTLHRREPIDGVLCWDEARIHATSFVAQALGLRNGDPEVIARLRDKGQTRAALAEAGVPQPHSVPVKDEAEALAAAAEVGYPAILKPRGLGASLGVVRVENAQELRRMFPFTRDTRAPEPVALPDRPVLVEECVLGEEISIDSVVSGGRVTPLFIGRKVLGYPPYAEEVGHYVSADDPLLSDRTLLAALQDTHAALGFTDGWTHSEYMLTSTGPKVIEVNGRLGGDLIPYLGLLATGIDPGLAAAQAACGLPPEPDRQQGPDRGDPVLLRRRGEHRDLLGQLRGRAAARRGAPDDRGGRPRRGGLAAAEGHRLGTDRGCHRRRRLDPALRHRPGRSRSGARHRRHGAAPHRRRPVPRRSVRHVD